MSEESSLVLVPEDRDWTNVLVDGSVSWVFWMVLGVAFSAAATTGTLRFFWTKASNSNHPDQLVTKVFAWTILPTMAVIRIAMLVTVQAGTIQEGVYEISPGDIVVTQLLLLVLLFALLRGGRQSNPSSNPPLLQLFTSLAAGLVMMDLGRAARGLGFNSIVDSATLTNWEPTIDANTSLIGVEFTTGKGLMCKASIRMDCTRYWGDIRQRDSQNDDASGSGLDAWKDDFDDTLIISYVTYVIDDSVQDPGDNLFFSCRYGPSYRHNNDGRSLEQQQAQNYQFGNDDMGHFEISSLLFNTHSCRAGLYTIQTFDNDYFYETPAFIRWLSFASILAMGLMHFCRKGPKASRENQDENEADITPLNYNPAFINTEVTIT